LAVISLLLAPGGTGWPGRLEALKTAGGIETKLGRVRTLVSTAKVLDGETRNAIAREALGVAQSISEHERYSNPLGIDERTRALMAVLPVLDHPERNDLARELFKVARAMRDERWRILAFKDLAAYLDEDQHRDLVRDARWTAIHTTDGMVRFEALNLVGPSRDDDMLGPIWQRWLRETAPGTRPELCRDLAVMIPVVAALGGPEAVFGLTRAVLDVGHWWL
jgi:hypothetical protein